jgi:glycerol-3-phosphate acyltransferase PlsY
VSFIVFVLCIFAYLVGSIPTGYWIAKWFFGVDVTKHGSGNIGATNVSRVLDNKKLFVIIFLLDFAKAYGMLIGSYHFFIAGHIQHIFHVKVVLMLLAVCLLLGNGFSLFLRFRGGKSVSTSAAILAYLVPFWAIVAVGIFLLVISTSRRIDIAALSAMFGITFLYCIPIISPDVIFAPLLVFMSIWLLYRHRENIMRIRQKKGW